MTTNSTCILWNVYTYNFNPEDSSETPVLWVLCVLFITYNLTVNILMLLGIFKTAPTTIATSSATSTTSSSTTFPATVTRKHRRKLTLVTKLYIGVCAMDILITLNFTFASSLSYSHIVRRTSSHSCLLLNKIWAAFTVSMVLFEQLLVFNIVLSRYIAIKNPFSNASRTTVKCLVVSASASFAAGVVNFFVLVVIHSRGKYNARIIQGLMHCIVVGVTNTSMIILNIRVLRILKKSSAEFDTSPGGSTATATATTTSNQRKNNIHSAKTLLMIAMTTFILSIPVYVGVIYATVLINIIEDQQVLKNEIDSSSKGQIPIIYLLSLGLNSQIYIHRSKKIKNLYKSYFNCWRCLQICAKKKYSVTTTVTDKSL